MTGYIDLSAEFFDRFVTLAKEQGIEYLERARGREKSASC